MNVKQLTISVLNNDLFFSSKNICFLPLSAEKTEKQKPPSSDE